MREIKFRAFRKNFGDDNNQVMTLPFTLGNLQDKDDFDFTNGNYVSWDEFGLHNKETIVMQFTGLKDKNGVDIYEGDILEFKGCNVPAFEMKWNNKDAGWINYSPRDEVEVVGNIHENKDLL